MKRLHIKLDFELRPNATTFFKDRCDENVLRRWLCGWIVCVRQRNHMCGNCFNSICFSEIRNQMIKVQMSLRDPTSLSGLSWLSKQVKREEFKDWTDSQVDTHFLPPAPLEAGPLTWTLSSNGLWHTRFYKLSTFKLAEQHTDTPFWHRELMQIGLDVALVITGKWCVVLSLHRSHRPLWHGVCVWGENLCLTLPQSVHRGKCFHSHLKFAAQTCMCRVTSDIIQGWSWVGVSAVKMAKIYILWLNKFFRWLFED